MWVGCTRSAWLFDGVCGLLRAGLTPEQVLGVITDDQWGISESVLDRNDDAMRYAEHTVGNALARVTAERGFEDDGEEPQPDESTEVDASGVRRPRYHRWTLEELLTLPPPTWTIEGILIERGLALLYGEPKSFKTFTALDMALSTATGTPFLGIRTTKGRVCYVAAEGHARETGERVQAWLLEHKLDPSALRGQFTMVTSGVKLDDPQSVKEFLKEDSAPCDITFFDTLNRNMEGNENDTQDMTKVVSGCDYVRRKLRTAVVSCCRF